MSHKGFRRKVDEAGARLDAVYARLPQIKCKGLCGIACGPILLTDNEARRLQVATHKKPRTILLAPHTRFPNGQPAPREACVYLTKHGRCEAYAQRPLICRTWGVVKALSCMHGCVPDRWMDDYEFHALAAEVERVNGGRLLITQTDGCAKVPRGFNDQRVEFALHPEQLRSREAVAADAEKTRALRALHGGRILAAITREP
jgi:hypothetical protein